MSFKIIPYEDNKFDWWNNFVNDSNEGTLFHRLDFLSYHGDKFKKNEHHLIICKGEQPFGIIPLAIFPIELLSNNKLIKYAKSPYGGSYGGPVFKRNLDYKESMEIIKVILEYLNRFDITNFIMTLPIFPCSKIYSDTFRLALIENNFKCINRDISSVVSLYQNIDIQITSRARNMVRKAQKMNVEIKMDVDISDFWKVLELTFDKHNTLPTHTYDELKWLWDKFDEIYFDVAYYENKPIAGIGYFDINNTVTSSFYFAQDPEFQNIQALSLLVYNALIFSKNQDMLWFDFGTSSKNMMGVENIFQFKESFNSIGFFRDTYAWEKL
jgi:hypothetical protein